ncbi:MAG: ABC transporter substrate-binding protein, partial [Gammaproteobacteria bacterium]
MKIFGVRHSIAFLLALSAWAAHAAPQRIVSLLPSLTESVCELGACSRLVG